MRIAICNGQIPFTWGGAESLADALASKLRQRGHEAETVRVPFRWYPKSEILKGFLAWRLLNLDESEGQAIDRVIALKFPAYVIRHPHKITWLVQQFRQAYDLHGTEHSHFDRSESDTALRRTIWRIDTRTLAESRQIFAISRNVSKRLSQFNNLESRVLYPPPALEGQFHNSEYGDYVLSISRLNKMKRVDLLVRAMGKVKTAVRCRIAGQGPELPTLQALARKVGAEDRIDFLGFVGDADAVELYAGALAVYYAPVDEDYGLATVEALKSQKPVLAAHDSGGVLEFIQDGNTGFVIPPGDPAALAQRIDELYTDRSLAQRLGKAGHQVVATISWDRTLNSLLEV